MSQPISIASAPNRLAVIIPRKQNTSDADWRLPFEKAEQAVHYLEVERFIEVHKNVIFQKLEENFLEVQEQKQATLLFIANSLPICSGVVHVGSTFIGFRDAREWVKETLLHADPGAILATLTLIYLVEKGYKESQESGTAEKKALWQSMRDQIQQVLS